MTYKTAPPQLRKFLPLFLILIMIPLLGCNLLNRIGIGSSDPDTMSVEQALEITPLDSRPTMLEEMGPPDAFTITFQELEGQIVRWESWSYFDYTSQFDFIDGELLWNIELEPVPDGSIFAHFYDPADFVAGMTPEDVKNLLSDQDLLEVNLTALDQEGALALAGDQILLGFDQNQLVYVETVILSPDPEGKQLIAPDLVQIPDLPPAEEPASTEEGQMLFVLQDNFESETPRAIPIATEDFMTLEHINGQGHLTANYTQSILVAYYEDFLLGDFVLEVDISSAGFSTGSKAGVIFHGEDPQGGMDHYYLIAIAPLEESLVLAVFQDTEWKQWDLVDIPPELISPDDDYHLGIDCQGEKISILLDGRFAAEMQNSLIPEAGIFGLAIAAYEIPETAIFDNLLLIEHP